MSKKIILSVVFGAVVFPLFGQVPTINVQHFFQSNKTYPYKPELFFTQSPGAGGANVVWDFSLLRFQSIPDTTASVIPKTTPAFLRCGIDGNDTATICLVNRSDKTFRNDDYHYYIIKGGKIIELGSDQDNGLNEDVNFQYDHLRSFSPMPFTYLTQSIDSFNGSYFSYLSGQHTIRGIDSSVADGYGTLKVDGSVYNNCVRLKRVSHWVDDNAILGSNVHHSTLYTWYSTDKEGPVLTMEPDPFTGVIANYYFPKNAPTAVEELYPNDLTLYPNPATDQLFIQFRNASVVPVQLKVVNTAGQTVLTSVFSGSGDHINIQFLPKGTYWCQVIDKSGSRYSTTFVKQ